MSFHPNASIQDPRTALYLGINKKLERLPKGSIPLYEGKGTKYTPELTGTGFGIHVGTFKMLITAGHVTDRLTDKQFYVPDHDQLRRFDCRIHRFGHAETSRSQDPIDISVIDLDEQQAYRLSAYHFFKLEDLEHRHFLAPDCHYAFVGYPATKNQGKFKATQVGTHLFRYFGMSIGSDKHVALNRPSETHLGIAFEKNCIGSDLKPFTAPDPHGMSGCPVWSLGMAPEIVDVANTKVPLISGMGIEWRDHALVAVRACLILQVIRTLHGELKTVIEECRRVRFEPRSPVKHRQLILKGP